MPSIKATDQLTQTNIDEITIQTSMLHTKINTINTHSTKTAASLHWLMAVLLCWLFFIGVYMSNLPITPWKLQLYSWHKWVGILAFILAITRIAWQINHRLPFTRYASKHLGINIAHTLLYLLMLSIPLSGWILNLAGCLQTEYLCKFAIYGQLKNPNTISLLQNIHHTLNIFLLILVLGHAYMAINHYFFAKKHE
jgi:cytochrome b561